MAKFKTSHKLDLVNLIHIFTQEIKLNDIIIGLFIAFFYLALVAVIPNWRIFNFVMFDPSFGILDKFKILIDFFLSLWTRQTHLDFWVLLISSIFVGLNIIMVGKTLGAIGRLDHVRVSVGGITLLSIVSSGCASCGLSIISIAGLSFSFLPFHGSEMQFVSLALLIFSLWYMTNRLYLAKYCRIR